MRLHEANLTIIGLGLMGGSMARTLLDKCADLIGVDKDPETVDLAQRLGIVNRATDDPGAGLKGCDLAILAVPVRSILDILARLGRDLPAPRFVLDLGSTKTEVVRAMESLPVGVDPLGGHPLCGKEASGLAASDSTLFHGHTFVLSPLKRTSSDMHQLTNELIDALGARPMVMDAERHDRLVATTSQLPYLFATALVAVAMETAATDAAIWDMIASGFRDTTRLAASDLSMMVDILLTNHKEVHEALKRAMTTLQSFASSVSSGDPEQLLAELTPIQRESSHSIAQDADIEDRDEP